MNKFTVFSLLLLCSCGSIKESINARKSTESKEKMKVVKVEAQDLKEKTSMLNSECIEQLSMLPEPLSNEDSFKFCSSLKTSPTCRSVEGKPIFHYDKASAKKRHIKVLVLGAIHGDEPAAGSLARDWIHRLHDLEPRSQWRILPVVNPDGLFRRTRMNANGVDVNRNFPTKDWMNNAQKYWRKNSHGSERRFPGNTGGSEPETKCVVSHIEDFGPDFIISIHTPYGVLDFDGPHVEKPHAMLPWRRLGHMPGSLGRFMWKDKEVPVLTIELKGSDAISGKRVEDLQDVMGTLAIRSLRKLKRW